MSKDYLTNEQTACTAAWYGWRVPDYVKPTADRSDDEDTPINVRWHGLHMTLSDAQARQLVDAISANISSGECALPCAAGPVTSSSKDHGPEAEGSAAGGSASVREPAESESAVADGAGAHLPQVPCPGMEPITYAVLVPTPLEENDETPF